MTIRSVFSFLFGRPRRHVPHLEELVQAAEAARDFIGDKGASAEGYKVYSDLRSALEDYRLCNEFDLGPQTFDNYERPVSFELSEWLSNTYRFAERPLSRENVRRLIFEIQLLKARLVRVDEYLMVRHIAARNGDYKAALHQLVSLEIEISKRAL